MTVAAINAPTATSTPAPSVLVRRRAPADIPALCALLEKQRLVTGYPEIWPLPCPLPEFIARDNETDAWVAEIDGVLVGHIAAAAVVDGPKGQSGSTLGLGSVWADAYGATTDQLRCIGTLFTDSDRAKAGIGAALLAAAVDSCRKTGHLPVLDCITEKPHVVEYYVRRGWRVVGHAAAPWSPDTRIDISLMILPEFIPKKE